MTSVVLITILMAGKFQSTMLYHIKYWKGRNRNEYQEYFLGGKGGQCVGLTTLPPPCAKCVEIWEPKPSGTLRVPSRSVMGLL
jgi:hypothetical protein